MRAAFIDTLSKLYSENKNIFVLTADLGYKLFDPFKKEDSQRFYNVGIAEANMVSMGAGLALSDKIPYCYSIIPFLIMRAFEQTRVDVAYHNANVRLVGAGAGFTYGFEGMTHYALEDFTLMRSLPNMTIVAPADPLEARALALASVNHRGPLYIRLGKSGDANVHDTIPDFQIGKPIVMAEGKCVALWAIGSMVLVATEVTRLLQKKGISTTLINMHTLKPLNVEMIHHVSSTHEAMFSLEEHYTNGGLGTVISEVLSESRYKGVFKRFGVDHLDHVIGDASYMKEKSGLTAQTIYGKILKELD